MAYCTSCGQPIGEGRFCPHCGAKQQLEYNPNATASGTASPNSYSQNSYNPNQYNPNQYNPNAYNPNRYNPAPVQKSPENPSRSLSWGEQVLGSQGSSQAPAAPVFPMKWHKFLIYFALWLNGILNMLGGLALLIMISENGLYGAIGAVMLGLGAYTIYVRFQLAGLRSGAPKKLMILLGCTFAINVLNALGTGVQSSNIPVLSGSLASMLYSWRYYSSRAELFVN